MTKDDISRLNELHVRFMNDDDYKEYEKLSQEAWAEHDEAKAEQSLLGEVDGHKYILILPYDRLTLRDGKWQYERKGFDMEIHHPNGRSTLCCQCLCGRDVKYFVDRMLEDKERAEREEEE